MSLRATAVRGFGIVAVLKVITATLGRVSALVLPLLLLPEDFGLFGIATFFVGLVTLLSDFGLGTELVRRTESVAPALDVGFTLRIALSVALGAALILLATPVALLYADLRLQLLIIVLALSVVLNAFTFVPRILATRRLDFKRAAVPDHVSKSVAPLASIGLAVLGMRYWSLAYGLLLGGVAAVVTYAVMVPWKPAIRWRRDLAKQLLTFGGLVTAAKLATVVAHGVDNLLVGYILGIGPLGFYLLAYSWAVVVPSNLSSIFGSVGYPIFSRIQDDRERLRRSYLESVRLYALVVTAIAAGVLVLAHPFVTTVFGATWLPAIPPMQVLALSGFIVGLAGLAFGVLYAAGRPRDVLVASVAEALVIAVAVPPALVLFGLVGAAFVSVAGAVAVFGLSQTAVSRHLGARGRDLFPYFVDPVVSGLVASLGVLVLQAFLGVSLLSFLMATAAFLILYVVTMTALTRGGFLREMRDLGALALRRPAPEAEEEPDAFSGAG